MKRIVIDPDHLEDLDREEKPMIPQKTNEVLDGWLGEISHKLDYSREEDNHMNLANKAKELCGGSIKDYLRMTDRELQDFIRINNGRNKKEET